MMRKTRKLSHGQEAERIKQVKKRSVGIESKTVDIAADLFDGIDADARREVAAALGVNGPEDVGNRDVLSAAVASHLPTVVSSLRAAGLVRQPKGKQRPRAIDAGAWLCLVEAEKLVDVHAVSLARAALVMMAREGVAGVDLRACLEALVAMGEAASDKKRPGRRRKRRPPFEA